MHDHREDMFYEELEAEAKRFLAEAEADKRHARALLERRDRLVREGKLNPPLKEMDAECRSHRSR